MKTLFLKYLSLNKELEKKGGRSTLVENLDLEPLYTNILSIENEILKQFGLPKLMKYREIVFDLKSKEDFEKIIIQLQMEAQDYLTSSLERDTDLLEDAKTNDLKTYDILPEIGIEDTFLAMFYFEEYFKKGKMNAKELVTILKSIDDETSVKIGHLHYYTVNGQNIADAEKIFNELNEKRIPYLAELRDYRPVYPY